MSDFGSIGPIAGIGKDEIVVVRDKGDGRTDIQPLHRRSKMHSLDGLPRYYYRGWIIFREERDWDARGYRGSVGNGADANPKRWWAVRRPGNGSRPPVATFRVIADAEAWIDSRWAAS